MKVSIRSVVLLAFGLCLGLLTWTGYVSYRSAVELERTAKLEAETLGLIKEVQDVVIRLAIAEAGQRGYVATGEEMFLESYHEVIQIIESDLRELGVVTQAEPRLQDQFQEIKTLAAKKVAFMALAVQTRRAEGFGAAEKLLLTGEGKRLMDGIRRVVNEMLAQQQERLVERRALGFAAGRRARQTVVIAAALSILIVTAAIFLVFRGVAVRDRLEQELEQKAAELATSYTELDKLRREQLHSKDQLLSHISHELRTPLNVIYQFLSILADGLAGPLSAQQTDYLRVALRNVQQLRSMIGDLLDATRVENAKLLVEPQTIALPPLIAESVRSFHSFAAEQGVALSADLDGDLPPVRADPTRLHQILSNLIHNAIKFTPRDGSVVVRARRHSDPRFVCVSVADSGRGILAEQQPKLFQRLSQIGDNDASRKGLGLGLYLCKEFVTRQGGHIWVESEVGRGSIFSFTLPVAEGHNMSPERSA